MVTQPPRREPPESLAALAEEATRTRERLAAMADSTAAEISRIDPRLKEPAQRDEERRIRSVFGKASEPLAARLAEIRAEIEPQAQHFTREAVRARAEFDRDPVKNATIGLYWLQRTAAASSGELVEIARQAAADYLHALGLTVEREVDRRGLRDDATAKAALELANSIPIGPQDSAVAELIKAALQEVDLAAVEVRETATGRREPESKLFLGMGASPAGRIRTESSGELGDGLSAANAERVA